MNNRMITNFWQETALVCGNHASDDEVLMTLKQIGKSLYYICPKHDPENRSEDETACANRITLKEFEKMLDEIFAALEAADAASTVLNLTNYQWKRRGLEFKVLAHTNKSIKISVVNRLVIEKSSHI